MTAHASRRDPAAAARLASPNAKGRAAQTHDGKDARALVTLFLAAIFPQASTLFPGPIHAVASHHAFVRAPKKWVEWGVG